MSVQSPWLQTLPSNCGPFSPGYKILPCCSRLTTSSASWYAFVVLAASSPAAHTGNGTYSGLSIPSFSQEAFYGIPHAQAPIDGLCHTTNLGLASETQQSDLTLAQGITDSHLLLLVVVLSTDLPWEKTAWLLILSDQPTLILPTNYPSSPGFMADALIPNIICHTSYGTRWIWISPSFRYHHELSNNVFWLLSFKGSSQC